MRVLPKGSPSAGERDISWEGTPGGKFALVMEKLEGLLYAVSGPRPHAHFDGWWPEACNGRNGWAIAGGAEARSRAAQDRRDADAIYELLEQQIVSLFYARDRSGVPRRWVRRMIAGMKTICGQFNTHRMLAAYLELYDPTE